MPLIGSQVIHVSEAIVHPPCFDGLCLEGCVYFQKGLIRKLVTLAIEKLWMPLTSIHLWTDMETVGTLGGFLLLSIIVTPHGTPFWSFG